MQGRFTSIDPVGTNFSRQIDPQQLNRYSFVRNSPLKYTDDDGRDLKLAPGLKKAEADRILKRAVSLYRKESGRAALERLEKSNITYELRAGPLSSEAKHGGVLETFGETKPDKLLGRQDPKTGEITYIQREGTTVGITLDLGKLDKAQSDFLVGQRATGPPSEQQVFNHEIAHGDDFDKDPVAEQNQSPEGAEKKVKATTDTINREKNTMSEEDAEKRVREILSLPAKEEKKKKNE